MSWVMSRRVGIGCASGAGGILSYLARFPGKFCIPHGFYPVSVDAEVLDDTGIVENLWGLQALLIDKDGYESVPHTLW